MLNDVVFVPDKKGPIVESNQGKRLRAQPRFFAAVMEHGVIDVPVIDETGARA